MLNIKKNVSLNKMSGYPITSPIEINGTPVDPAQLNLNNNSDSIQISAPASLSTTYSIVLPNSLGSSGQALILSGGSNTTWGAASNANVWIVKDVKAPGTDGGTFTSGAWRTRVLNNIDKPTGTGTEVQVGVAPAGANQLRIEDGEYQIEASVPAEAVALHQSRFRNISDSTTEIAGSCMIATSFLAQVSNISVISGTFTVSSGPKVYEIQHQCSATNAVDGFGSACGFGENEVYTIAKITKIS